MTFLLARIKGIETQERIKLKITKEDYEKLVPTNIEEKINTKLKAYKGYCEEKILTLTIA